MATTAVSPEAELLEAQPTLPAAPRGNTPKEGGGYSAENITAGGTDGCAAAASDVYRVDE